MRFKLLSLVFFLVAILCLTFPAARADSNVGEEAGSFVVKTRDGKIFDLDASRGKVVLINFWATWCPSCRTEMPMLEVIWRRYHSQGLEIVAVNVDRPQTRAAVKEVSKYFTFPIALFDAIKKNDLLKVDYVPISVLIGKDGKVSNILTPDSDMTEEEIYGEIKALLAAKHEKSVKEAKKDEVKE